VAPAVLDGDVDGEGPPVETQEGEAERPSRRRPARHVSVEAVRRLVGCDRGAAPPLPPEALDPDALGEQVVEMAAAVGDRDLDPTLGFEPSPATPQFAPQLGVELVVVRGPSRRRLDVGRASQGALDEPVPVGPGGPAQRAGGGPVRGDEPGSHQPRPAREQHGGELGDRVVVFADQLERRRVVVGGADERAASVGERRHPGEPVAAPEGDHPQVSPAERAPPGADPSRTEPGARPGAAVDEIVPGRSHVGGGTRRDTIDQEPLSIELSTHRDSAHSAASIAARRAPTVVTVSDALAVLREWDHPTSSRSREPRGALALSVRVIARGD
jgi:hypothetical protein